jgi:hypothetical protein
VRRDAVLRYIVCADTVVLCTVLYMCVGTAESTTASAVPVHSMHRLPKRCFFNVQSDNIRLFILFHYFFLFGGLLLSSDKISLFVDVLVRGYRTQRCFPLSGPKGQICYSLFHFVDALAVYATVFDLFTSTPNT